jgi:hypothetical protein
MYVKHSMFKYDLNIILIVIQQVCFNQPLHSLFFRLGQVLPVVRGGGIYQVHFENSIYIYIKLIAKYK